MLDDKKQAIRYQRYAALTSSDARNAHKRGLQNTARMYQRMAAVDYSRARNYCRKLK